MVNTINICVADSGENSNKTLIKETNSLTKNAEVNEKEDLTMQIGA